MKHIASDAYLNAASTKVLVISKEAKERKARGINVVDATIGMLIDKNGLITSPVIDEALKNSLTVPSRAYPAVDGGKKFNDNLHYWIFRENEEKIKKNYLISSMATSGGTGALTLAIKNYVDSSINQEILIPNIRWGNYNSICNVLGKKFATYEMFNKFDGLNIDDIKKKINESNKRFKRSTIIINDPCQNPSGYSLQEKEWIDLFKFFDEVNKIYPLTLILDIAYMDFAKCPRLFFELLAKKKHSFLTLVCFSASKSFAIYGLRLGAIIAIADNNEDIDNFKLASIATARSLWSCTNNHSIAAFNLVLENKSNFVKLDEFYKKQKDLINKRKKLAIDFFDPLLNAKKLPYVEGFFLTYEVDNADKVAEELKKKNIFVLPMQNKYIRIALCSYFE